VVAHGSSWKLGGVVAHGSSWKLGGVVAHGSAWKLGGVVAHASWKLGGGCRPVLVATRPLSEAHSHVDTVVYSIRLAAALRRHAITSTLGGGGGGVGPCRAMMMRCAWRAFICACGFLDRACQSASSVAFVRHPYTIQLYLRLRHLFLQQKIEVLWRCTERSKGR